MWQAQSERRQQREPCRLRLDGCGFDRLRRFLGGNGSCLDGIRRSARHVERLADADAFIAETVRGLQGSNRYAVFAGDLRQAVARLNLVTTGRRQRLTARRRQLAGFGGNLVTDGGSRRQHGHVPRGRAAGRLVAIAVESDIAGGILGGIAGLAEFRNEDRLAGLRRGCGLQTVDAQQFLFRNAVTVGECRDAFAGTQGHGGSAIGVPAILVGTYGRGGQIVGDGSGSLLGGRRKRRRGLGLSGRERLGHGFVAGRRIAACHGGWGRKLGTLHRRGRRAGRGRLNAAITTGLRIGVAGHVLVGVTTLRRGRGVTAIHVALRDRDLP